MKTPAFRLTPLTTDCHSDSLAGDVPAPGVLSGVAGALPLRGLEQNMSVRRRRCC